jgi:hypothetical protein
MPPRIHLVTIHKTIVKSNGTWKLRDLVSGHVAMYQQGGGN